MYITSLFVQGYDLEQGWETSGRRGETVLRPSLKGPNVIWLYIESCPNIYQHLGKYVNGLWLRDGNMKHALISVINVIYQLDVMELPKGPDGKAKVKVGEYE